MITNYTSSRFRVLANVRKHCNSPILGVVLNGSVEKHDGVAGLGEVVKKIVELTESETGEYEFIDGIQIILEKKT